MAKNNSEISHIKEHEITATTKSGRKSREGLRHYKLLFVNTRRNKVLFSFRMPAWVASLLLAMLLLLTAVFVVVLMTRTPLRAYLPGYLDLEKRTELVGTALRLDSLERASNLRSIYLQNVTDILSGRVQVDTVARFDSSAIVRFDDSIRLSSERERAFVLRMEEQEKYVLGALTQTSASTSPLFLSPVHVSYILSADDKNGICYELLRKVPVIAPMDGTIVAADYMLDGSVKILIQHPGDFVSELSALSQPTVEVGRICKVGTVVGHAGDNHSSRMTYRLWYKGVSVNPQDFMMPE